MEAAFAAAETALALGEVPVGAALADGAGQVLATAGNRVIADSDPSAHAEMLVIRRITGMRGEPRLGDLDLYVTLEPCGMCAQAIAFARLRRLYFAAYDPKGGGVEHGPRIFDQATCHHRPEIVGGLQESRGKALLQRFFAARREG